MKAAALAMARQAELKTVDANQTVFSQGFEPSAFSLYSAMLAHYPDSTLFSNATTLGEIGNGFYFVLQGSVKIKVNNTIVKVRCSLRLSVRSPDSADHRPLSPYPDDRLSHPAPLARSLAKRLHSARLRCCANANALPRLVRLTQ